MAQKTQKRREESRQAVISSRKWLGMNVGHYTTVGEDESGNLLNVDLYSGRDGDYIESRRGSQYLKKASGATKRGSTEIAGRITWDIGSEEYLITQEGTGMYAQALITTDNPVAIALAVGGAFALGSTTAADLFISGDKLYVLHPSGNYVIRWTGSAFVAYPMGLAYPWIATVTSANAGVISGSYTLGIEKVYQASGVDLMASTPNRRIPTTRILAQTGTIESKKIKITIQATELDNDTLWTHLRVWRSKNKNNVTTDILNPIDAQGNDDELYEEALITKAEIGAGSLTAIATGSTLPLGNAGTTAGKPASVYTVELNNLDTVFFNLIGIDRIELLPIPACTTGCFCANRIFFSGIQDATLDDASKNNIWYSNYAGTKYAFQYNPLNYVDTGRDGQNMIKVMAFEKDVIGIKEGSTGRLPSGNVDIPYQTLDSRIGIKDRGFAGFVPGIGVVAITSDFGDFRIFGYDLRWTNILDGRDISTPVRSYTSAFTAGRVSFAYINGKLMICYGTSNCLVLHAKEQRGWTLYRYTSGSNPTRIFTFAQGSRAALVTESTHLIEIEKSTTDGDINVANDVQGTTILANEQTYSFQRNGGRDILEHEYLSLSGKITVGNGSVYPFVNGCDWPIPGSPSATNIVPSPSVNAANADMADREFRVYFQPGNVGTLKWCPMAGNYLAYDITISSPATIRTKELHCIVDENGMAWGGFDPFNTFPTTNTDPTWAQ